MWGARKKSGWGVSWTTSELSASTPTSGRLQPRTRGNGAERQNKGRNISRQNGSLQKKTRLDCCCCCCVVVFTLTDRASTIPSNIRGCQSGTWSQRGTKVNGSHHGDNPLLRPTGIQIATKSYATLQAMAPTNNKTVHQTSFTPYYREQPRSTRIVFAYPRPAFSATMWTNTFQPVLINNSKFLKATHRTKIRKIEIPRSMVVEALSC